MGKKLIFAQRNIEMIKMFNTGFWITYLSAILNMYVLVITFKNIAHSIHNLSSKDYFLISVFSFFVTINNLYNLLYIKAIITIIITTILYFIIFRYDKNYTIFYSLIISIVSLILDFALSIFATIFVKNIFLLNYASIQKFLFSILYAFALYFFFKIKPIIKIINKFKINYNLANYFFCFSITIIVINLLHALYTLDFTDYKYYILTFIFITILIIFNYGFYSVLYETKLLKLRNGFLEQNMNNSKKSLDDYKLLKHNLINDLMILKNIQLDSKNEYINNIISKYSNQSSWINNLGNIPSGIQGIIYSKLKLINDKEVSLFIDNKLKEEFLNNKSQEYFDFCEAFSICLDNAIEAVNDSNNKVIYFNLYSKKKHEFQFDIINSFSNSINIDKLGRKNYSTKNRSSGLGLNYLFKKKTNIKIKISVIDDLFQTSIFVKEK